MNMGTKGMSGPITGAMGIVEVTRGTGDTNSWTTDVDLSKLPPRNTS
jgi:hypothetical protein